METIIWKYIKLEGFFYYHLHYNRIFYDQYVFVKLYKTIFINYIKNNLMHVPQNHYKFVKSNEATQSLGVSEQTLRRWADTGKIQFIKTPSGHRLYSVQEYIQKQQPTQFNNSGKQICYCRVSSKKQEDDLQRQINSMQTKYPHHEIVSDIGSGINFKRKGLRTILEQSSKGNVKEVVVSYKDRLCRFAFELVEWLLSKDGVKLVVLYEGMEGMEGQSNNTELAEDLLSIINVFNCKVNEKRKYNKKTQETQIKYKEQTSEKKAPRKLVKKNETSYE
jgi:predicted site-specific integrase-resolvase